MFATTGRLYQTLRVHPSHRALQSVRKRVRSRGQCPLRSARLQHVRGHGRSSNDGVSEARDSAIEHITDTRSETSRSAAVGARVVWPLGSPPQIGGGFGPVISVDDMVRTLTYSSDPVWELVRREAEIGAANEPQLASSLYATVLNHRCLEDTLAFHLANELASPFFQATQYVKLFRDALYQDKSYREAIRADLLAVVRRDPAMKHCVAVLMYSKGYAALQAYRLAHLLWRQDRKVLALFLQSEISKCFAVDIHPAARIGSGVMIDHATGIVIGETAVVGNDVSMLHNVTLGGTGKEAGDRHPKVGRGVLLGAGATVLGNIRIGDGAQITASSVVLKDVPPYTIVSGVPAREVGKLSYPKGVYPAFEMDQRAATAARVHSTNRTRQHAEDSNSSTDWYLGDAI